MPITLSNIDVPIADTQNCILGCKGFVTSMGVGWTGFQLEQCRVHIVQALCGPIPTEDAWL